jgi:hypothetical protein
MMDFVRKCLIGLAIPAAIGVVHAAAAVDSGWAPYVDDEGTIVAIPMGTFSVKAGRSQLGRGERFTTADGRAELAVYVLPSNGHSPASYLRAHMKDRPRSLDYHRVSRRFFAVSKYANDKVLYRRCNFSVSGTIHCVDISYPRREERSWDDAVTRISRSLRPL